MPQESNHATSDCYWYQVTQADAQWVDALLRASEPRPLPNRRFLSLWPSVRWAAPGHIARLEEKLGARLELRRLGTLEKLVAFEFESEAAMTMFLLKHASAKNQ